ncbi:MAG: diguanylate cyclase, partial [Pseudomonadota bacterium]|nr:diguanylate cyclase [Pseudomonadota bacterium]
MPNSNVTTAMIDDCVENTSWTLAFPDSLEKLFEERVVARRRKLMTVTTPQTLLVYNTFLIVDYLLVPETFLLAVLLHLAIVSPAIYLVGRIYGKVDTRLLRDFIPTVSPLMIVGQIMFIFWLNSGTGTGAEHYHYLAILVVIYSNVNQRYGFRQAATSTAILGVTYLAFLLPSDASFQAKFIGASMILTTGYLSLMASHRMELDLRRDFLKRLKDRLLREGAEEVSMRDPLTGLTNRRQLDKTADKLWNAAADSTVPVAAVMFDIDYFKAFN